MFKILLYEESVLPCVETLLINYNVNIACNIEDILNFTHKKSYNLYIVNLDSYSTIKELKEMGDSVPTLFIDEYYSLQNMKRALSIGDDYLVKPLNFEALSIRLDYYYRKIFNHKKDIIIYKNFYYHIKTKQLYNGTKNTKLSPNELKLLELFLNSIDKPIFKDTIMDMLESISSGSLRVYISKLKKLGFNISYSRAISSYILTS